MGTPYINIKVPPEGTHGHNTSFPSALAIGAERAAALLPHRARCFRIAPET